MLDFYFDRTIKMEDLLADENIMIVHDDGWTWYGLADDPENTAIALFNNEYGEINHGTGHDAATPVAFYLYETYGIKFHDNCQDLYELDKLCDKHGISLTREEWDIILDSICLDNMLGYIKPGCDLYERVEKEMDEYDRKREQVFDKYGIQKLLDEMFEENRRMLEEEKNKNRIEAGGFSLPEPETGELPF